MAQYHKYKPVRILPFLINNRGVFIEGQNDPGYHPSSTQYDKYWDEEAERCIKGFWGEDKRMDGLKEIGGWRWCPGNLYFFGNYCKLMMIAGENRRKLEFPMIRDTEWVIFYDLAECDGFSGFTLDGKYTSFLPIFKLEKGIPLSHYEQILLKERAKEYCLLKKDGSYKEYREPRFLMYATYKDPVGDAMYHNPAQNYMILSTRRLGKSGGMSNGVVTYDFTFNGSRTLEDYVNEEARTTVIVGGPDSSKTKEFLGIFKDTYEYLRTGPGAYDKDGCVENGVFWKPTFGSINKENEVLTNRVPLAGNAGYAGPGSKIVHLSFQKDGSKTAGYGARRIIFEEFALLTNFLDLHRESAATQVSDWKYGYSVYIGTGGDVLKIDGPKDAFYNPHSYDILPCPDLFNNSGKPTGRFIPSYYVKNQYRDENGNQDIVKAFEDEMGIRDKLRADGGSGYLGHMISFPFMPQEMFLQIDGNRFPADRLEQRAIELLNNPVKYSVGRAYYTDKMNTQVRWDEDLVGELTPFFTTDSINKALNTEGAIVIYEHPVSYRPASTYEDAMYILCVDCVLNDTGTSKVHATVHKRYDFIDPEAVQFGIVAEWYGRFDKTEDNHEQVFKMAYLYDAKIFPEMNIGHIVGYARITKRLGLLQPALGDIPGLSVQAKKNYEYGIYVAPLAMESFEKILDEMLREVVRAKEVLKKDVFTREEVWYVDTIPSRIVVEQLINYSRSGNFDAVSSQMVWAAFCKGTAKISEQYRDSEQDRQTIHAINQLIARNTTTMLRR